MRGPQLSVSRFDELAPHGVHADILIEQILDRRRGVTCSATERDEAPRAETESVGSGRVSPWPTTPTVTAAE